MESDIAREETRVYVILKCAENVPRLWYEYALFKAEVVKWTKTRNKTATSTLNNCIYIDMIARTGCLNQSNYFILAWKL